jgi:hypothetical protein
LDSWDKLEAIHTSVALQRLQFRQTSLHLTSPAPTYPSHLLTPRHIDGDDIIVSTRGLVPSYEGLLSRKILDFESCRSNPARTRQPRQPPFTIAWIGTVHCDDYRRPSERTIQRSDIIFLFSSRDKWSSCGPLISCWTESTLTSHTDSLYHRNPSKPVEITIIIVVAISSATAVWRSVPLLWCAGDTSILPSLQEWHNIARTSWPSVDAGFIEELFDLASARCPKSFAHTF